MNDFSDMLRPDAVLTGVVAANKKAVLQQLAACAADRLAQTAVDSLVAPDAKTIADSLVARERL